MSATRDHSWARASGDSAGAGDRWWASCTTGPAAWAWASSWANRTAVRAVGVATSSRPRRNDRWRAATGPVWATATGRTWKVAAGGVWTCMGWGQTGHRLGTDKTSRQLEGLATENTPLRNEHCATSTVFSWRALLLLLHHRSTTPTAPPHIPHTTTTYHHHVCCPLPIHHLPLAGPAGGRRHRGGRLRAARTAGTPPDHALRPRL